MAKSPPAPPVVAESFESAMSELESIVQGMEGGKLTLEQSLAAYQRGADLLRFCQETLAAAEQKVQVLEAGVLKDLPRSGASSAN
ncbi:MAG TPA: exodeoxyribonuclease VII small subunit [Rhodocyclaceae bacterium]|nr:exodeoxyribonuclease VII small subunit [Rhodocyclaceae bacterium]HNB78383.1 exodeoxyribonuclease VII small subunit [Rhodocyclaceae bacterium]HNC62736.1 exodeoxyribonuclease VII small subunit [Rhodocyclaceae bacterium]